MYYHSQNLTDSFPNKSGVLLSKWKHGRLWLRKTSDDRHGRELHCEWAFLQFARSCHCKLHFGTGEGDDAIAIRLAIPYIFQFYISLDKLIRCKECECGIAIYDNSISFSLISYTNESNSRDPWYRKSQYFDFPWKYQWYKTEILSLDRKKVIFEDVKGCKLNESFSKRQEAEQKVSITLPYRYIRNNGDIQNVNATVCICRITHRMKWVPFVKKDWTFLDIKFDKEIGEGVDTWKGGVLGCSFAMLPNETPEQCLRRMEKEVRYNR